MLGGKLVSLRELEPSDLRQLFKWNEEAELYLFKGRHRFMSYDEVKHNFLSYSYSQQIFIIEHSGQQQGICSYWDLDWRDRCCEFYGEIFEKDQNAKRFLAESLKLMISFLFDHQNLYRVFAYFDEDNGEMCSVLEELGFTREGTLREHKFCKGQYINSLVYSQLKDEYKSYIGSDESRGIEVKAGTTKSMTISA